MSKANTNTNFFQADFAKLPDFLQMQTEYGRMLGEFGRAFGNGKSPLFDVERIMNSQRKNVEALTAANQVAFEGVQAVARRQAEIVRQAVDDFTKVTKELTVAGSPEDKLARQANVAKQVFETAVSNLREITEMVQKSNSDAAAVISQRVSDNLDEVKSVFASK